MRSMEVHRPLKQAAVLAMVFKSNTRITRRPFKNLAAIKKRNRFELAAKKAQPTRTGRLKKKRNRFELVEELGKASDGWLLRWRLGMCLHLTPATAVACQGKQHSGCGLAAEMQNEYPR